MSASHPMPAIPPLKRDADYVFFELTRSLCPDCRKTIDAHILLKDNKVYMRKRCPEHGVFEVAGLWRCAGVCKRREDSNKPGTIPLAFSTKRNFAKAAPTTAASAPDHQQHVCLGIIEVNSACNMDCPLCFANAGHGFSLTLAEVEEILDHLGGDGRESGDRAVLGRRTLPPSGDRADAAGGAESGISAPSCSTPTANGLPRTTRSSRRLRS